MKKAFLILLTFFSFSLVFAQNVLPKPNPPRLVNDAANVLSPEQVASLEHKLVALDDSTSNQIAVVLIKSLGDYDIEEYAQKLFREWGIGNKKTNNGVLIIAAIDDRKLRIHVGYGLEGAIPDIVASSIDHDEIAPRFAEKNYYQGIDDGINAITKAAVGEYKVKTERKVTNSNGRGRGSSIFTFIIIVIVIIIFLGRGGSRVGGGGLGGLAEGMIIGSLLGGGRGGGGDWGGGGGDSGGGFGGFGGGDAGGGGAGGSW